MKILIDQVTYDMRNKGNIAILQTAVKRLSEFWPDASLEVISLSPLLSKIYLADCKPVPLFNVDDPGRRWNLLNSFHNLFPRFLLRIILELRDEYKHLKSTYGGSQLRSESHMPITYEKKNNKKQLLENIDLFVVSGAHFLCDDVKHLALEILDRLELAVELNIPTVMVGQGIGPIRDADLVARSRSILPRVDLFLVREKVFAPLILNSLGVSRDRIFVTGDDAVEMAYNARSNEIGRYTGVGIRVSSYTGITAGQLEVVQSVLHDMSLKYDTGFISLPISYSPYEWDLDEEVIQRISSGRNVVRYGLHRFEEPLALIKLARKCRIVITGAFHPAVFALSQGIPTICLVSSESYKYKFFGLADLFGNGCKIIELNDNDLQANLASMIASIWEHSIEYRPQLLKAAEIQVELNRKGYNCIYELVSSKINKNSLSVSLT